jgi:MFS family permease
MVMSSIGSMVFSLQAVKASWQGDDDIGRDTLLIRTRQVQLIAIANTASRLFIGLASDMVSPSRSKRQYQSAWKGHLLNIRISRVAMLLSGLALLAVTFTVAGLALNSIDQLWIVSIATGLGYGLVFTIVPTLIMRAWPRQFGRNFGLLNYLAALGSLSFSMLFAYINDSVAVSTSSLTTTTTTATCRLGRRCFEPSFLIAAFTLYACFFFTLPLYRAWRHVV